MLESSTRPCRNQKLGTEVGALAVVIVTGTIGSTIGAGYLHCYNNGRVWYYRCIGYLAVTSTAGSTISDWLHCYINGRLKYYQCTWWYLRCHINGPLHYRCWVPLPLPVHQRNWVPRPPLLHQQSDPLLSVQATSTVTSAVGWLHIGAGHLLDCSCSNDRSALKSVRWVPALLYHDRSAPESYRCWVPPL